MLFFVFAVFSGFYSCSPVKYLKDKEYLLIKTEVKCDDKSVNIDEVSEYIKQNPNRKVFGVRFHTRVYNLINPAKEKKRNEKYQARLDSANKKVNDKYNAKIYKRKRQVQRDSLTAIKLRKENNVKDAKEYEKKVANGKAKIREYQKQRIENQKDKVISLSHWLLEIGEAPVVYDPKLTVKGEKQMQLYLKNKGYYDAKVTTKVKFTRKKAKVFYTVLPGKPYVIDEIKYIHKDSGLISFIEKDRKNSVLKKGRNLDVDLLSEERYRMALYIKNQGFFKFEKEFIVYKVDTALEGKNVNLEVEFLKNTNEKTRERENHKQFRYNKIYIYSDYDPKTALSQQDFYFSDTDTLVFNLQQKYPFYFVRKFSYVVKPHVTAGEVYLYPDSIYNITNYEDTYKHLAAIRAYRLVNIQLREVDTASNGLLNCYIQLTPGMPQSYTIELEGTNSSGNMGAAGNLIYQHKNLFRGGEIFDFRFKSALERQINFGVEKNKFFNTEEYGVELTLQFPRLLAPINTESFSKRFNPRTTFTVAFNYQNRPDYTRTILNASIGYLWKTSEFVTHIFHPFSINSVRIPHMTDEFRNSLSGLYIKDSYEDHLVQGISYSYIFNNQELNSSRKHFIYFKTMVSLAGNLLNAGMKISNQPKTDGSYLYPGFEIPFAQFAKSDIDVRYYQHISVNTKLAWRMYAGAGLPYGNTDALPFGEKYFSGGANSIRAWQARSLGPGSYSRSEADTLFVPNQTADVKLELNFEFRKKLFWMIEGAYFIDAGNIWAINNKDNRQGAKFELNRFYKELAIGTGVGIRMDFSFFIFRFDFGLKLYEPASPLGQRWIPGNRSFKNRDWTFNVGIGYPF